MATITPGLRAGHELHRAAIQQGAIEDLA